MKSATLKRVVSLVLVFAFVLTALPFALAAEKPTLDDVFSENLTEKNKSITVAIKEMDTSADLASLKIKDTIIGLFPSSNYTYSVGDVSRTFVKSSLEVTKISLSITGINAGEAFFSTGTANAGTTFIVLDTAEGVDNTGELKNLFIRLAPHTEKFAGKFEVTFTAKYKETFKQGNENKEDEKSKQNQKLVYTFDVSPTSVDAFEVIYNYVDADGNVIPQTPVCDEAGSTVKKAFNNALQAKFGEGVEIFAITGISHPTKGAEFLYNVSTAVLLHTKIQGDDEINTLVIDSKGANVDQTVTYTALAKKGAGYFAYTGSIKLTAYKAINTNLKIPQLKYTISTSTYNGNFALSDIVDACLKERQKEDKSVTSVKIDNITFTYNEIDLTLTADGYIDDENKKNVESGKEYGLFNFNTGTFYVHSKKQTSDVSLMYTAKNTETIDGKDYEFTYTGYIVFVAPTVNYLDPISGAYSIYNPNAPIYGEYEASAIAQKVRPDAVVNFKVKEAVFTYTTTDSTGAQKQGQVKIFDGKSWSNYATYGYLTKKNPDASGGITTFTTADTLRYYPGITPGTVTITYEAYGSNKIYTGTMTFTVYSVKDGVSVTLNLKSRAPYLFSNADNDKTIFADSIQESIKEAFGGKAVCKYVVFDAVQKSSATYGTLYADSNKTALSVRSASQPTAGGYYFKDAIAGIATAPIANLYYVPTLTAGSYTQNYSVFVSFDGKDYELPGTLTIKTQPDSVINPDILYQVTTNTRVTFAARDFDTYLKNINKNYTFDYVRFTGMPASGNLFYGNTEITAPTLGTYDFYETAGITSATINNVSYVPAGTNYYVTIPFTVYYKQSSTSTPASRTGTIVICVTSGLVQDINYTTKSGDSVYLKSEDFTSVCQAATGATLGHVYFTISSLPATDGRLSYSQQTASIGSSTPYYVLANAGKSIIDNVKFTSAKSSGTVTFQYTAYDAYGVFLYSGKINVKLYTETKTPAFSKCVLSAQKMICNGQAVSLQAYNIDGFNYLKLRDIAALLSGTGSKFSIQVTDNGVKREVSCTLGGNYTIVADDLQVGADQSKTCVASSWAFYVDGEYKSVYVYNIGGYNYFKLRDLGSALKFGVDYNSETNTAIITSSDYIA